MTIYSKNNPPCGYYVYAYLREDNSPYYIGKGKDNRAFEQHRVNNKGVHTPKNHKKIIIIEHNITEIGALAIERRLIAWYGRKDVDNGMLHNRTDGGEGGTGKRGQKYTSERKTNISKSRNKGIVEGRIVPWNKGKTGLQEAWNKGLTLNDEQKKNYGAPKGREPWNKGKTGLQEAWNKGKKLGPAHNKGVPSGKKGMTYEEIYGPKKAKELRERCRERKQKYWEDKKST